MLSATFAALAVCASNVFAYGPLRGKGSLADYGVEEYGVYDDDYLGGDYDHHYDDWANKYCRAVCRATPGCRHDPHAHGSYCKFQGNDGRPAVCFGLYRIPKHLCHPHEKGHHARKYCFEPFSRHCNDRRLRPVRCDRRPEFDSKGDVKNLELHLEGDDLL